MRPIDFPDYYLLPCIWEGDGHVRFDYVTERGIARMVSAGFRVYTPLHPDIKRLTPIRRLTPSPVMVTKA